VKVRVSPLWRLLPRSVIVWLLLFDVYDVGETLFKEGAEAATISIPQCKTRKMMCAN
jgi:hypothetical protein